MRAYSKGDHFVLNVGLWGSHQLEIPVAQMAQTVMHQVIGVAVVFHSQAIWSPEDGQPTVS
jgi:hypothetical protein